MPDQYDTSAQIVISTDTLGAIESFADLEKKIEALITTTGTASTGVTKTIKDIGAAVGDVGTKASDLGATEAKGGGFSGFVGSISKGVGVGMTALVSLGAKLTSIGVDVIGGVISKANEAVELTKEWALKVDSVNDVLGTTPAQAAGLILMYESTGQSVGEMNLQLSNLVRNLESASGEKLGRSGKALENLGISARDASGNIKPTAVLLQEIADKLGPMPAGLDKTKFMVDLFGRSSHDLNDTLTRMANGGLAQAIEKSEKMGKVLSDETINAVEQWKIHSSELNILLGGIGTKIGAELLPAVIPLSQKFGEVAMALSEKLLPKIGPVAEKFGEMAVKLVDKLLPHLDPLITAFVNFAGVFADKVLPVLIQLIPVMADVATKVIDSLTKFMLELSNLRAAISSTVVFIETNWSRGTAELNDENAKMQKSVSDLGAAIDKAIRDAIFGVHDFLYTELPKVTAQFTTWTGNVIKEIGKLPEAFFNAGKNAIQGFIDGMSKLGGAIIAKLRELIPDPLEDLLKLGSPSKLFEQYGRQAGEGWLLGLRQALDASKMLDTFGLRTSSVAFGAFGAGVQGTGGSNFGASTINVTVNASSLDNAITADMVGRTIADRIRRGS